MPGNLTLPGFFLSTNSIHEAALNLTPLCAPSPLLHSYRFFQLLTVLIVVYVLLGNILVLHTAHVVPLCFLVILHYLTSSL